MPKSWMHHQRTWINSCVSHKSIFDARATNSAISSTAKSSTNVDVDYAVVHTRDLTCVKRNVAGQLRVDAVISFPKHHRHVKIVGNSRAESVLDTICTNWVFPIETETRWPAHTRKENKNKHLSSTRFMRWGAHWRRPQSIESCLSAWMLKLKLPLPTERTERFAGDIRGPMCACVLQANEMKAV